MATIYNSQDKTQKLAIAYGEHAIHAGNGKLIRHRVEIAGSDKQVTAQLALAAGPLQSIEKLTYDAVDIPSQNYIFHSGDSGDAGADAYFPQDVPHPGAAWLNFRLPVGMSEDNQPDKAVARVKCLKTADYNAAGSQTDFGYSANPARAAADFIKRLTSSTDLIEFAAFDEYKSWCNELIPIVKDGSTIQINRFRTDVFFQPPFSLKQGLDRICQLTCTDWQERKGKIRFMPAVARLSEFTFDLTKIAIDFSFQAQTNRDRPNGVRVTFRDLDDELLREAEPIVVKRQNLIDLDEGIENFTEINAGVCYRDQATRVANYWAKVYCDLTDFAFVRGAYSSYKVLPGDLVTLTHPTPNWTSKLCKIIKKTEKEDPSGGAGKSGDGDKEAGYKYHVRVEPENPYSDSDYDPIQTREPAPAINPYAAPPAPALALTEQSTTLNTGVIEYSVKGVITFGQFGFQQSGKVYWMKPGGAYELYQEVTPGENNQATFHVRNLPEGVNFFKVIAVSQLGVSQSGVGGDGAKTIAAQYLSAGGYNVNSSARRTLIGFDPSGRYTGRDLFPVVQAAIRAQIDSVTVINDDVDVLLGISFALLGNDGSGNPIHNETDSANAAQIDVFNQFGELVKSFSPAAINSIGGQAVCKFPRKYADPQSGQCYFKIKINNIKGYSLPIYLQGTNSISANPPAAKLRGNCPTESYGVPFSASAIRCFYQFTGNVNLLYRKPGDAYFQYAGANISASPFLAANLAEYTDYEFQFESSANTFNKGNIFRARTKQQGEAAPERPAPTGISGGVNPSNPQGQLDFSCVAAANVETEVFVNGGYAGTIGAVGTGNPVSYSITGLSASTSRSVKFRHKWGTNDYSAFTEEITRITDPAAPPAQHPLVDYSYYYDDPYNSYNEFTWTPRGGTGTYTIYRKINNGSFVLLSDNYDANATSWSEGVSGNLSIERYYVYRLSRNGVSGYDEAGIVVPRKDTDKFPDRQPYPQME